MNTMIKIKAIALLVLFTGLSMTVLAQGKPGKGPEKKAEMEKRRQELKAKLNLTEVQSAKFDEITARHREEAKKKASELPPDATQAQKKEIMKNALESADKEIMELLDSEQQAIYKAEKEKMKQEAKEKKKASKGSKTVG